MAKKGLHTEADALGWEQLQTLVAKMSYDIQKADWSTEKKSQEAKFLLFIASGSYTGLRSSDILQLKWEQLYNNGELEVVERKTKKYRKITINPDYKKIITDVFQWVKPSSATEHIFTNRSGKVMSIQYANRKLKEICDHYRIWIKNVSTHSLRKCFGKRVYEMNFCNENALVLLSHIFNHANVSITRRYIGLQQEKIMDVYLNL